MLATCTPAAACTGELVAEGLRALAPDLPVIDPEDDLGTASPMDPVAVSGDDPAQLQLTSGTTGTTKAVVTSHQSEAHDLSARAGPLP